jgi:ketosteroid isomerase-like protein
MPNNDELINKFYTAFSKLDYATMNSCYSKTGKKVVNKIRANMKFADGKIIEHSDAFSLHKWSAQALGFSGWLLGWNRFFQNKIKNSARKNLLAFMQAKRM